MMNPPNLTLDTVATAIDSLEQYFLQTPLAYGQGTLEAYDEAVYLTLFALNLPPDDLDSYLETNLTSEQQQQLTDYALQRVVQRKPVAYITQESWLMGFPFYVDERVIIPRSFIAEILLNAAHTFIESPPARILDLCTGSGCLAIISAMVYPEAQVTAIDLSGDAIAVANINQAAYGLEEQLTILQGNLFSPLPSNTTFNLIVCNPPYVNQEAIAAFPIEFQKEPLMAFAAGNDGMDLIRSILQQAGSFLSPKNGILLLEIGQERQHFEAAFPTIEPLWIETTLMEDAVLLLTYEQLQSITF